MTKSILQALRNDHDSQRALLVEIERNGSDRVARREYLLEFEREHRAHVLAEERSLSAPLLANRETQSLARRMILEHQALKALLDGFVDLDAKSVEWRQEFRNLRREIEAHLTLEERFVFPRAELVLSIARSLELSRQYAREKRIETISRQFPQWR